MSKQMSTELQKLEHDAPAMVQSETSSLLAVIARAAADPNVQVEKMERILALQERVLAKQAEAEFAAAMERAQAEVPLIKNDSVNTQTNSRYAKLKTMNKLVVPVYTRHGFSLSFGTTDCPVPNYIRITCKVRHRAGHSADYQADVPLDVTGPKGNQNKTLTHGFGSSLSYGRRYLTMLIFNVATTDDDDGQIAGGGKEESPTVVRKELWERLKPVRGDAKDWSGANQYCWDEGLMDPEERIEAMTAERLVSLRDKVVKRLKEQGHV